MMDGRLEVEGGSIWYRTAGAGGVPLVCLHGGPGATHDYLENILSLSDDRMVVLYDQLGGGRSDRPRDRSLWTAERFVDELDRLVRHLGLQRFHLLGQSWGSMLAVLYAQMKGQGRLASLVLSAPYLSSPLWDQDQRRHVHELPEKTRKVILESEARGDCSSPAYAKAMDIFYRRHVCRMPVWPENLNRSLQGMGFEVYNHMWGPSEFTLTGNLKGMDATKLLPGLRVPVLYTCGEFDEATPATTRRYAELTPDSQVVVFPGASHMHHLESQAEFLSAVRAFLKQNER
jgi:proline iminopeptidase